MDDNHNSQDNSCTQHPPPHLHYICKTSISTRWTAPKPTAFGRQLLCTVSSWLISHGSFKRLTSISTQSSMWLCNDTACQGNMREARKKEARWWYKRGRPWIGKVTGGKVMLFTTTSLAPLLFGTDTTPCQELQERVRGTGGPAPGRHKYTTLLRFLWPPLPCHMLQKRTYPHTFSTICWDPVYFDMHFISQCKQYSRQGV